MIKFDEKEIKEREEFSYKLAIFASSLLQTNYQNKLSLVSYTNPNLPIVFTVSHNMDMLRRLRSTWLRVCTALPALREEYLQGTGRVHL